MAEKRFSFSPEMTAELPEYLRQYKTERDFYNIDFNSDKAKQHEYVRRQMAENNPQYFGPVYHIFFLCDTILQHQKEVIILCQKQITQPHH